MAELTKQALIVENNTNFPNNNTGYITPALLREFNTDMIDSTVNQTRYNADSSSWNSQLASIEPVATGSLLVTASAAGNTITFEKGDGSTFDVVTAGGGGDVSALNAYTASNNAWWADLNPKTGSYASQNTNVTFTSVTASFKGDGSQITNVTASFTGVPISNDGIPQGTAGTLNFTGSAVNASVIGGIALITVDSIGTASFNSFTQSVQSQLTALENATSSYANSASVAAVDAGQQAQINSLIAASSSFDNTALNAFTASIAGTNAWTASAKLDLASLAGTNAFTASIKGTNTFTASLAGTNAFTQSTNTSIATINNSLTAINSFTASNSTYDINVWTGSINQFTQSAQASINALNAATSSYAKTNVDNRFTTGQTITGSLVVTGTITANEIHTIIESSSVIYSSGSNQLGDALNDTQILSGSVKVVGGLTVNGLNVVTGAVDTTALNQATASLQAFTASIAGTNTFTASIAGTNTFTASAQQSINSLNSISGGLVTSMSADPLIPNTFNVFEQDGTIYGVTLNISASSTPATDISALNAFTASVAGTNAFTASIAGTNAFTQSASARLNSLEATTASLNNSVSSLNTFSASALTTASANLNTITFTKGNGTTFAVTVNTGSGGPSTDIAALNAFTASVAGTNAFTASAKLELAALELFTASIAGTNAFTQSAQNSLNSLNAATSSYITSAVTASMAVSSSLYAVTSSLARNVVVRATNDNQSTLPVGTVVRISGATGDVPRFNTASYSDEANSSNTLGVLNHTAASGVSADITVTGIVTGINTDGMTAGDLLYLGANGGFTNVQPQAPLNIVVLGEVLRVQLNNGSMFVNISNGWELNELHNVRIVNPLQGDLLVYEATSSLWKNQTSSSFAKTNQANTFNADQTISGSLVVTGNLNVFGSASFTTVTSSIYLGGNTIRLNTFTPAVRFGGMEVIDSGSGGLTGSLLWDSDTNHWLYTNPSGSTYNSAWLISGPKNTGAVGNEIGLATNYIMKAVGDDHISSSQMQDDGVTVTIPYTASIGNIVGLGNPTAFSTSVDSRINGIVVPSLTSLNNATASLNAFTASALTTASFSGNTLTFTKGNGTTFGVILPDVSGSGASFPYTGSAIISGSLGVTGSISVVSSSFSGAVITNLTDTYTDVPAVNQIVTLSSASYASLLSGGTTNPNTLYIVSGSSTAVDITALNLATASLQAFTASIAGTNAFTASTTLRLNSIESKTGSFATTGSNAFVGTNVFSGSVQGRVIAATITSNTASLDFSQGNFFTLALAATVGTHISASNVQPGETVSIRITQNATPGTVTYPPAMKFPSGSAYTASTTANAVDVITFISYDNSTVYASSVKNLV